MRLPDTEPRAAGPDPAPGPDEAGRLARQHRSLVEQAGTAILDAIPGLVVILNDRRRIVYANRSMLDYLGLPDVSGAMGKRPGEALDCIHSRLTPDGCGTSEFCSQCGAVRSILVGLSGRREVQECRLLRDVGGRHEALDLLASSSPLDVGGDRFVVFSLADISHEKRRRALERTFFHDILNTAGGLKGLLEVMRESLHGFAENDADLVHSTFSLLIDEMLAHKDLLAAESNELAVKLLHLRAREALDTVLGLYGSHPAARGKAIRIDRCDDLTLCTDLVLLRRVLGNLVKNALEASAPDDVVALSAMAVDGGVEFAVRNPAAMARELQLQLFKRSFSTKGRGRGLGTYSVKLLVERYLGGSVSFQSAAGEGTVFRIRLPLTLRCEPAQPVRPEPGPDGSGVLGCGQGLARCG